MASMTLTRISGLNAPFGARCFLTTRDMAYGNLIRNYCLNAPYGARCFLTPNQRSAARRTGQLVLMCLMALGAF